MLEQKGLVINHAYMCSYEEWGRERDKKYLIYIQ